ncbi:MAG: phospholipase D-like domain-containing protein, partial [Candidatus Binatus sp.]
MASHIPHSNVGSYPLRYGNFISPLVDGEPAFRRICETVEAARHSVWVTVAFIEMDFQMPDGRGSLFDVLERAKARGLDVRVIFWRMNDGAGFAEHEVFSGSSAHRSWLQNRGSRFLARWDRAQKHYCHHQKTWLIDAGQPSENAFVGGINLGRSSMVSPGHSSGNGPHTHDVYVEVRGPAATDVHHNFVQRWNEASERTLPDGGWPDGHSQSRLDFPRELSAVAG